MGNSISIGKERQLFLDDYWIEEAEGTQRVLHHPERREPAIPADKPWEEGVSYMVAFKDGKRYRAWYRCDPVMSTEKEKQDRNTVTAYAESGDGVHWEKPVLGLMEFQGSRENNIVWAGPELNMAPFRDDNPRVREDERYKAIIRKRKEGILGMVSPDGLNWCILREEPLLTEEPFDSHNIGFWDDRLGMYVAYTRGVAGKGVFKGGVRWIRRAVSEDFHEWSPLESIDIGEVPDTHLYTNSCVLYDRAPATYLMFPSRFVPERMPDPEWECGPGVSDIVMLSSRDGLHFDWSFREAFVRPGLDVRNWHERAIYMERGILFTADKEMSLYGMENWRFPTVNIRRYALRTDGFVSVNAGYGGGNFTTPTLLYEGRSLEINYSTSAVGSVRVELRDGENRPVPGFTLAESREMFGDEIGGTVSWKGNSDLSGLSGKPVKLRFYLKDADLYAFCFH